MRWRMRRWSCHSSQSVIGPQPPRRAARNAIVHNGVLDSGTHLLPKPFSIDDLASKMRSILDGY